MEKSIPKRSPLKKRFTSMWKNFFRVSLLFNPIFRSDRDTHTQCWWNIFIFVFASLALFSNAFSTVFWLFFLFPFSNTHRRRCGRIRNKNFMHPFVKIDVKPCMKWPNTIYLYVYRVWIGMNAYTKRKNVFFTFFFVRFLFIFRVRNWNERAQNEENEQHNRRQPKTAIHSVLRFSLFIIHSLLIFFRWTIDRNSALIYTDTDHRELHAFL